MILYHIILIKSTSRARPEYTARNLPIAHVGGRVCAFRRIFICSSSGVQSFVRPAGRRTTSGDTMQIVVSCHSNPSQASIDLPAIRFAQKRRHDAHGGREPVTLAREPGYPAASCFGYEQMGSTNGAAAKVMSFDILGKNVRPDTFGKIKVGEREYPKSPSVKNMKFAVTP